MSDHTTSQQAEQAYANTDRELWREPGASPGMEYYQDAIHVTEQGGIGINVGGTVVTLPLREWHALAMARERLRGNEPDLDATRERIRAGLAYGGDYMPSSREQREALEAVDALVGRVRDADDRAESHFAHALEIDARRLAADARVAQLETALAEARAAIVAVASAGWDSSRWAMAGLATAKIDTALVSAGQGDTP